MNEKKVTNRYRWQPEIATSLIYWSFSFGLLFLSIIALLEQKSLNALSILFLVLACGFIYMGWSRYFDLTDNHLIIRAILRKNSLRLRLSEINKVSVGANGFTIVMMNDEVYTLIMSKKSLARFTAHIQEKETFSGKIVSAKKESTN
ncbi:EbsA family protein [Vagococcus fessus]|uniref:EbsA protein n=1 Tax=Vagococcus fessus TaxID=120370 RepID=A0A430ACQ4_9ENTE|nr:EbsA family protein [Vagococcus fessus]RSU04999.1 hypothetical protein CBF31_02975 [Vagococcus fessus]